MTKLDVIFTNKQLLGLIIFILGFSTAFWGAFEFAYQSDSHPIWSGTWGYPVPHHYVIGFIMLIIGFILLFIETFKYKLTLLMGTRSSID